MKLLELNHMRKTSKPLLMITYHRWKMRNLEENLYDEYAASILDAKYEKVDLDGIEKEQSHIT